MTIANPIYDIVFKYLMEDLDIAKGLLSTILNVEIIELSFQPQETISENPHETKTIRVYRIDFAAIVKQTDGQTKKVLIELQKTKRNTNALRFRRYLGENYQKEDTIIDINGKERKRPLEIITIYILGFPLNKTPTAVLHSKPCFRDLVNNESADYAHAEEFIKLLTHESYFIQIPRLVEPTKTRIEKVLSVFNQTYKSSDEHSLNFELTDDDPLLQKMVNRLTRAIADEEMRRKMNIEDEIEREFAEYQDTIEQKDEEIKQNKQVIEQNKQVIEQKDQVIEQKDQVIEQKDQVIEQNKQELEQREKENEELKRQLEAYKKLIGK
jgi:hypothetical protein